MQKGTIVGRGMTAEVYRWGQDKVLKLYFDWFPEQCIRNEAEIGEAVYKAGVSSPAVYEMVSYEGRKGMIFQRVAGKSMLKLIQAKPWKAFYYAGKMAELHAAMHACSTDRLPAQKDILRNSIKEAAELLKGREEGIIRYLDGLPGGSSICHGDFHPDNIIVTDKKMATIDWNNAYSGNKLGDVARTWLMIRSPFMPPGTSIVLAVLSKILKRYLCSAYIKEYVKREKVSYEEIDSWILPVAAARLRDKIPGDEKWLMKLIEKKLNSI